MNTQFLILVWIIFLVYFIKRNVSFLDLLKGWVLGSLFVVIIVRIGFEQYQDRVKDHCQKEHKCVCKIK